MATRKLIQITQPPKSAASSRWGLSFAKERWIASRDAAHQNTKPLERKAICAPADSASRVHSRAGGSQVAGDHRIRNALFRERRERDALRRFAQDGDRFTLLLGEFRLGTSRRLSPRRACAQRAAA